MGETVAVSVKVAPAAGFEFETVNVVVVAVVLLELLVVFEVLLHPEKAMADRIVKATAKDNGRHLSSMVDPLPNEIVAKFGLYTA